MDNGFNPALLKGSTRLTCENCGGMFFKQVALYQIVSKFKVGATSDVVIPIPISRCDDCGQPIATELAELNKLVEVDDGANSTIVKSLKPKNSGLILE